MGTDTNPVMGNLKLCRFHPKRDIFWISVTISEIWRYVSASVTGCWGFCEWAKMGHCHFKLQFPVVFQCVPIMQINTGSPLEHHWVLASASVVPVASQCTCGYSRLPVWSVQWYPSVLTESGLEVIRSGHFPACDPLCIQLVWWELFELNWFHLTCTPNTQKV